MSSFVFIVVHRDIEAVVHKTNDHLFSGIAEQLIMLTVMDYMLVLILLFQVYGRLHKTGGVAPSFSAILCTTVPM
jgi:hypothetical protein